MDWTQLARDGGGWVVAVAMAVVFLRSLLKGDLVLGREYTRITGELDKMSAKAEAHAKEQQDVAARDRAEFLERLASKQAQIDRLTGGPESS